MFSKNDVLLIGPIHDFRVTDKLICFKVTTDDGRKKDYHNVIYFTTRGNTKHLQNGDEVQVEGRLSYRTKEINGDRQTSAQIIAEKLTRIE